MMNPQLGTSPRPDVTGIGIYKNLIQLGASRSRTEDGFADPWNGVKVEFDFPADKHTLGAGNYEIWCGLTSDYVDLIDPLLPPHFTNDLMWGLAKAVPDGEFMGQFIGIPDFGDGIETYILKPNDQLYIVVRALYGDGDVSEQSEMMGLALAHKPTEGQYPYLTPPPIHPWDRA